MPNTLARFEPTTSFEGPDLDSARWTPGAACRSRRATRTSRWIPSARAGRRRRRGAREHPALLAGRTTRFQAADSAKHLVVSTDDVRGAGRPARRRSPSTRRSRTSAANPADYRRGMAAFHVFDLEGHHARVRRRSAPRRARSRCTSNWARRGGLHTTWSSRRTRTSKTTSPSCGRARSRSTGAASTAAWSVDGQTIYEARGAAIPEHVQIGFGIWTMLPIRDGAQPARSTARA